ncbi:hypothetical protein CNMCM5623_005675 [Aspergillus felis]|uniref:Uncharacterized protein n=1 Tax=Aspergillus felis TaxID=1287682 RepID=A0A8H6UR06_9EURO|nr:hypothetical protein CNMCM5623_005675 [Aspergillus felis]
MHFIKCYPQPLQLQTLQQALQNSSRRHRLYIAAGLACGVIQYHGNWLEEYWDTSDIYLPADHDGGDVGTDDIPPSNNLYLPWSLNSQYGRSVAADRFYELIRSGSDERTRVRRSEGHGLLADYGSQGH